MDCSALITLCLGLRRSVFRGRQSITWNKLCLSLSYFFSDGIVFLDTNLLKAHHLMQINIRGSLLGKIFYRGEGNIKYRKLGKLNIFLQKNSTKLRYRQDWPCTQTYKSKFVGMQICFPFTFKNWVYKACTCGEIVYNLSFSRSSMTVVTKTWWNAWGKGRPRGNKVDVQQEFCRKGGGTLFGRIPFEHSLFPTGSSVSAPNFDNWMSGGYTSLFSWVHFSCIASRLQRSDWRGSDPTSAQSLEEV